MLQKLDASARLLKRAVKLSKFDIKFQSQDSSYGSGIGWFCGWFHSSSKNGSENRACRPPTWDFFVDGSLGEIGSGADIVVNSPDGHKLNCAVRFRFKVTNNMVKYETLLAGLQLAREMQVKRLHTSCDFQLVVSQVKSSFSAKDKSHGVIS